MGPRNTQEFGHCYVNICKDTIDNKLFQRLVLYEREGFSQ